MSLPDLSPTDAAPPVIVPPPPAPSSVSLDPMAASPAPATPPAAAPSVGLPQVDANFRVKYAPGDGPPGMFHAPAAAPQTKAQTKEQWLNQIAATARPGAFKLVVRRLKPAQYEGYRLTLAPIEELDLMPHDALSEAIKELHGGGEYQILVKNADQEVVESMFITIDPVMFPPKIPVNSMKLAGTSGGPYLLGPGQGQGQQGYGNVPGMSADTPEMSEFRRLKTEEQREMQAEQTFRAQLRSIRAKRELDKESRLEGEEDMHAIQALREEMRATQAAQAQQLQQMMTGFKDMVTAIVAKPAPVEDKTVPMVIATMKESSESQARYDQRAREMAAEQNKLMLTLITAMMSKNNSGENTEIMKMGLASVEKIAEAGRKPDTNEKFMMSIVSTILENKLGGSSKEVENFMRGVEFASGRAEDAPAAEGFINPDGGFLDKLGGLILQGVSRLASSGGGGLASRVGNLLTPPGQRQFALPAPAQEEIPAFEPPGQVQQFEPPQAPQQVQRPQPVPPPVQAFQPQPVAPAQHQSNVVPLYTGVIVDPQQASGAGSAAQSGGIAAVDAELPEHVSEAMRIACQDLQAGRTDQDWADYARGKWGHFLSALIQAGSPEARLRMIESQCAPEIYRQFVGHISGNAAGFQNFINSLHTLLAEYQTEVRVA